MYCDVDNNGFLDYCEVHDCVERVENDYRDNNCPCYGYPYCGCPIVITGLVSVNP